MKHPYTRLFVGTTAPTVDEDSGAGYEIGDIWIDETGDQSYQAMDVSVGAAVWEELTGSGGGASDWGDIGGTLSDQTDLQAALDAKLDDSQLEDAIANGVTTKAPSQNAVFDALALKLNTSQLEDAVNNGETTKAPTENAVYDALAAVAAAAQPLDSDLTAIAGLSPANDDIIQRKAGAWTFRTVAQYIVDLGLGSFAFLSSLAHSSLTGIGANDHHNQSHDHSASGDGQALAPASTFALTGDITPSTLTGDVNDYDPTGWSTASVIRLESGSPSVRTITGLAGGADGRVVILVNKGATYNVNLASESASSSAANRFSFGSSAFQLAPGRAVALIYDATASRWRPLVIHDHTQLSNIGNYAHSVLDAHRDDTANPHSTTLSQVSAFNDAEGNPADVGTTADGTSAYAARRDHVHGGGGGSVDVATDTIWDAKGDLAAGTGANTAAKLTVGADLQILTPDTTQSTGLRWATGIRELLQSATPSGVGTVAFSSIPGTYNSLEIEIVARGTESATFSYVRIFFNNDKIAANYRYTMRYNYGAGTTTAGGEAGDDAKMAVVAANTAGSNQCGRALIVIPFYAETTFNKMASSHNTCRRDSNSVHVMDITASEEWESTAAITRVDVDLVAGNYVSGTKINLYGVK